MDPETSLSPKQGEGRNHAHCQTWKFGGFGCNVLALGLLALLLMIQGQLSLQHSSQFLEKQNFERGTGEKKEWICSYGELVKSLVAETALHANKTNGEDDLDHYNWQDFDYDGPRYKPRSGSNRTVSLCAVAKNEEAYLDEWWLYYKALGVSTLYLYENDESPTLRQWAKIQNKSSSNVHYVHFPTGNNKWPQRMAYHQCLIRSVSDGHTWAALFDLDEYLLLRHHLHIVDFLEEYAMNGSVVVSWMMFGTNNAEAYSPQPVTKRFTKRHPDPDSMVKTIALLSDVDLGKIPEEHFVHLKSGRRSFDTDGNDLTHQAISPYRASNLALLFHYRFKSFKEYIAKRERGDGATGKPKEKLIQAAKERRGIVSGSVYDDSMWEKMKDYVPKYALYDILYPT
jgi:hypothetical protein